MELISVVSAKAIWLINTLDLNPKGLRILPKLTEALIEAYDFDPPPQDPSNPNSVKLKDGMFEKGSEVYRVGLEIYDDGFVGESAHSTELTEEFLTHTVEWATANFDIKFDPSLLMRKVYVSEVVVRFTSKLATVFQPFADFSELLARSVDAPGAEGFMLSALTFTARIPVGNNLKAISIERRANTSPDSNVFYCKAPLPTKEFLELLDKFDVLLSKN